MSGRSAIMSSQTVAAVERVIRVANQREVADGELLRRFAADGDQAAFTSLVRRHGAMVLGVCRRLLHNAQDAEDACQATFVVLAKKAAGGKWQPSIANWLYTTARKVAHNARVAADRRAKREGKAAVPEVTFPLDQMTGRELLAVLDEELDRLPPRYREPLVLCYLQGLTRDEATTRLGVPSATLKSQLDRGRKRLGDALTRRGVALGAGLLALSTTSRAGAFPARVASAILSSVRGTVPATVAELTRGVVVNGLIKKAAFIALAAIGAIVLGMGLGSAPPTAAGPPADKAKPADKQSDAAPPAATNDTVTFSGRVLGPDGKPVAGAKLYLTHSGGYLNHSVPSPERGKTGADGRFQFAVPKSKFGDQWSVLAASAPNHGPGWVQVVEGRKRNDRTIQLVEDDVPITGQIIDLEGKPIPKVTLRVEQISAAPGEDMGPWLKAVRGDEKPEGGVALQLQQKYLPRYTIALSPAVTTDAEGKFRLTGIGRNRVIIARVDGPTIASQHIHIMTRAGEPIRVTERKGEPDYGDPQSFTTYYGANFKYVAAPTRPIVGVVRDKDTKKPLAGVTVRSYAKTIQPGRSRILSTVVRTTTDAEGRYRLTGMSRGEGYSIVAIPGRDQPYVATRMDVTDGPGLDPRTIDIDLKRGVWIEGKITDKVTGKPLKGAVEYFSMYDNPNMPEYPGFDGTMLMGERAGSAKEDGSFRVVGLPGPGVLGVYYQRDPYLRANERDDEFGLKDPPQNKAALMTAPYVIFFPGNYNAIARIDPAKGAESVKVDVTIDPGRKFTGTVLGPDGKPLAGARGFGLWERSSDGEVMAGAEFTAWSNPRHPHDVVFRHPEKGLVGVAQSPKGNDAVRVQLAPGAAVAGRLIGADGKPRPGVELELFFRPKGKPPGSWWNHHSPESIKSDRDGRFRVEALPPTYEFELRDEDGSVQFGDGLRAGEVKDLGDVRSKSSK
jgi:RNA polymerase sigma factor (sigma-70 family)